MKSHIKISFFYISFFDLLSYIKLSSVIILLYSKKQILKMYIIININFKNLEYTYN